MRALTLATLAIALFAQSACAGPNAGQNRPVDTGPAQEAAVTASPTAVATASEARSAAPLVTNSGINLGGAASAPANPRASQPVAQTAEPDLRQFQTSKGTTLMVPSTWASQSPISISQRICSDSRCIAVDEAIQLFTSADGEGAVGLVSMSLPLDAQADATSLLPGAVRGAVTAVSAAAGGASLTDGPSPATVTNARRALSARASIVDPSSGETGTMTVVAAAGDHEIDALLIGASDGYLRAHQQYLERIRASFHMGGPTQ
jgi:hypothetical protein